MDRLFAMILHVEKLEQILRLLGGDEAGIADVGSRTNSLGKRQRGIRRQVYIQLYSQPSQSIVWKVNTKFTFMFPTSQAGSTEKKFMSAAQTKQSHSAQGAGGMKPSLRSLGLVGRTRGLGECFHLDASNASQSEMVQILEHRAGRSDRNGHQVEHSQGHQKEQEKDLKERSVDHLGQRAYYHPAHHCEGRSLHQEQGRCHHDQTELLEDISGQQVQ